MRKFILTAVGIFFFSWLLASGAHADVLGQSQEFYLDPQYDSRSRTHADATLRALSSDAYGYIEDDFWNRLNKSSQDLILDHVGKILKEFDDRIYPIETGMFGSEPNPGVDNDPRITILFTSLADNAGGYFNTSDCYAYAPDNMTSNQREMFYLNVGLISDETKMEAFLAHEFQHLISFNQKNLLRRVDDDTWLNETRSEFTVSLLGYNFPYRNSNLEKRIQSFLANPSDSLTEWKNAAPDYGQIALFGEYLSEHWPSAVLSDALKSDLTGIPSLNAALAKNGSTDTFSNVFKDWMVANILNNPSVDPKFDYTKTELSALKVIPTRTFTNLMDDSVYTASDIIKDWQQHWYEFSGFPEGQNLVLKLKFVSSSMTSFQVPYLIFKTDGTVEFKTFVPDFKNDTLYIDGIGSNFNKIVIMPFKKDKISGFGSDEAGVAFSFTAERTDTMPAVTQPDNTVPTAKPADYGLREGDFIRAEGDIDVYIINDFGYKRLILNPAICLMYGHLGARGCFSAVKVVSPAVRDAFKTSWLMTNGDPPPGGKDGKIYQLEPTGEDTATLHWLNISGADFINQGGDFNSVFVINSNEQKSFTVGSALTSFAGRQ